MFDSIIVGAGISGLSSALHLAKKNKKILLLEASPKCGGRTYSFSESGFKKQLDNGQHLLLGCYDETIALLSQTRAKNPLRYFNLSIPYVERGGKEHLLNAGTFPYPLNLLLALLNFTLLPVISRLELIVFFTRLFLRVTTSTGDKSAEQWLSENGQDKEIRKKFWMPFIIATMNTEPEIASAEVLRNILRRVFFTGDKSFRFVLASGGLSESLIDPNVNEIYSLGGIVRLSTRVDSIIYSNENHFEVKSINGQSFKGRTVVLAVPPYALKKINGLADMLQITTDLVEYSPIVTVHCALKQNPLQKPFYNLVDSEIQWVFNHRTHITSVSSAAFDLEQFNSHEIFSIFQREVKQYLNISPENFGAFKVIKEKRATFVCSPELNKLRPATNTIESGFFLAGDWISNGLPATIEGAVINGKLAANNVEKYLT